MPAKVFRLQGSYRRLNRTYRFSREVRALTEDVAREQLYALLGSFHRVDRKAIAIERVDEIPAKEAKLLIIRQLSETE
jgi:large subunit ribosomal protein LX